MIPNTLLAYHEFAPVLILILIAIVLAVVILALGHVIGPRRMGAVKDSPYESGMPVIGDARRRFKVAFYIVAMLFLLFDVEVVFMWPWALVFHDASSPTPPPAASEMIVAGFGKEFLLGVMAVFVAILLVGYAYAWRKGVFRWN